MLHLWAFMLRIAKLSIIFMFLGCTRTLTSHAFVLHAKGYNSLAMSTKARPTTRMSTGSDYVAQLPGAPFPDGVVWDPLGFSKNADPAEIKKWREAEIKHGRVSMLATVGVLVAEKFHPLFLGNDYIGPAVDHFQEITARFPQQFMDVRDREIDHACRVISRARDLRPLAVMLPRLSQFWVAALLGMAYIEYIQINIGFAEPDPVTGEGGMREDYIPGDLGFDPLGLKPQEEAALKVMKTKELNHGRLAMIGITGMLVQELVLPHTILP